MEKTMDKIVALCKARGFVYPGSEIYGGLANSWDYGNLGVELKNNIKKAWWQKFVQENPYNVEIVELEASQIPRTLPDVDIAAINGNYAVDAGLKLSDALAVEAADSLAAQTYGNVLVVKEGNEDSEVTKALVEVLLSEEVKEYINATYEGAVVPVF